MIEGHAQPHAGASIVRLPPQHFPEPLFCLCIPLEFYGILTKVVSCRGICWLGVIGIAEMTLGFSIPGLIVKVDAFGEIEIVLTLIFSRVRSPEQDECSHQRKKQAASAIPSDVKVS
jgi:hypothetical protein